MKKWERAGKTNRHHIKPKKRKKKTKKNNIINMDINRHQAFHFLFGNMTFIEAANLLIRADKMKRR